MKRLVALVLCLAACTLGSTTANASTITIGSYDGTRAARPFTGSDYSNLIAHLLNPLNFGPGGIVADSVAIAGAVPSVNASILAAYQVFVMGEVSSLAAAEAAALADFVTSGGLLVMVMDSSAGGLGTDGANAVLSLLDGSSVTGGLFGLSGDTAGSITASGRSSNGPFGDLVGGSFAATPGASLVAGPNSTIIGTNSGVNVVMETTAGAGAVLTVADVLFQNFFVPPGNFLENVNNALLFENFISSASRATPVPEPASLALLGAGLIGSAARRYRRRKQQPFS